MMTRTILLAVAVCGLAATAWGEAMSQDRQRAHRHGKRAVAGCGDCQGIRRAAALVGQKRAARERGLVRS